MGECSVIKRRSIFRRKAQLPGEDIAQNPNALADIKELGFMTTPVLVIDGSVIVGFDVEKIDRGLAG